MCLRQDCGRSFIVSLPKSLSFLEWGRGAEETHQNPRVCDDRGKWATKRCQRTEKKNRKTAHGVMPAGRAGRLSPDHILGTGLGPSLEPEGGAVGGKQSSSQAAVGGRSNHGYSWPPLDQGSREMTSATNNSAQSPPLRLQQSREQGGRRGQPASAPASTDPQWPPISSRRPSLPGAEQGWGGNWAPSLLSWNSAGKGSAEPSGVLGMDAEHNTGLLAVQICPPEW